MPTTPLDANSILRIKYHAQGHNHVLNLRCNLVEPYTIGSEPSIESFTGASHNVTAGDFLVLFLPHLLAQYESSEGVDSYEAWDMQASPPILVYAANVTGYVGTHTGGTNRVAGSMTTITLRDSNNKKAKIQLFSSVAGQLARTTTLAGSAFELMTTDLLNRTAGQVGDYICSRGAHQFLSFMSESIGVNNAFERKIIYG